MSLSNQQRRYLRGLSHNLKVVVAIADKGLSDTVRNELETALAFHELLKVRIRSEREARTAMIEKICKDFSCELVHAIGQVASFYRLNPEQAKIEFPSAGHPG